MDSTWSKSTSMLIPALEEVSTNLLGPKFWARSRHRALFKAINLKTCTDLPCPLLNIDIVRFLASLWPFSWLILLSGPHRKLIENPCSMALAHEPIYQQMDHTSCIQYCCHRKAQAVTPWHCLFLKVRHRSGVASEGSVVQQFRENMNPLPLPMSCILQKTRTILKDICKFRCG